MKKLLIFLCVIIMTVFVFAACTDNSSNNETDNNDNEQTETPLSGEDLIEQISEEVKGVFE